MSTRKQRRMTMHGPSFWEGAARVLDLGSTFSRLEDSRTPQEADQRALLSDWSMTGHDLFAAIGHYDRTLGPKSRR